MTQPPRLFTHHQGLHLHCIRYGPLGQPPQRPPSLAPLAGVLPATTGLAAGATSGAPFRGPYPQYNHNLPPRNIAVNNTIMPGFPTVRPGTGFAQQQQQQRGTSTSAFAFAGGLGQAQGQGAGVGSGMQPPLPPPSTTPSSELGLEPNDFPALGSGTSSGAAAAAGGASAAASYASQAGVAAQAQGGGAGQQQRDFTPDDFPALGGQQQQQQAPGAPPGLNGFGGAGASADGLASLPRQQTPGLLNLGPVRSASAQAQASLDAEKQRVRDFAMLFLLRGRC
jgi:CCR4-NOT transcription complex subunit 2